MGSKNHKLHKRGTLLLLYTAVSVISVISLFPVVESVKKAAAAPITAIPNNTTKINEIHSNNPINEITTVAKSTNTNSLIVNKIPIYQATGGTLGLTKLKSAGFPQEVESIFENGTINGVGKVTNLEAWIFSPAGSLGLGHGVITTKDRQMITWTAHDISGTNNKNGTAIYRELVVFNKANNSPASKLAFLNNLEGSYVTEASGNNQTTRIWKLK